MRKLDLLTSGLTACLLSGAVFAAAPVKEYALENGMKILVVEDHRAPTVVTQVWYKVGSSYEIEGKTGIAHALEHMMFKGTDKYKPNQFSKMVSENGGRDNAFTGQDYTMYFEQMEKSRLPVSFELEADRMRSLTLAPEEFAKEIKVVMEERRLRTEDDPESLTYEIAAATAYQTSPYRRPVIGWMSDLERMTVADLRDWYQRYYAPNNATLVIAGDVNGDEVLALAKEHFGPLKPSTIAPDKPTPEVPQRGMKRVTVRAPAKLPYLMMAYKAPVLTTAVADPKRVPEWEIYALDVLSGVLDAGESARLTRNLIRGKQIAASADAGYDAHDRLDTLFTFSGTPAQGQTVATLEEALRAEIKAVQDKPVEPGELERVKTQVVTADIYQKDSVFYQGMEVGGLVTVGLDWKIKDQYVDKIKAVTAEQVQAVARKYLVDDNLTVAQLDPQPLKPGQKIGRAGGSAHVH